MSENAIRQNIVAKNARDIAGMILTVNQDSDVCLGWLSMLYQVSKNHLDTFS